jgi:hypothetical protein
MMFPWYMGIGAAVVAGLLFARFCAGPRKNFSGPTSHFYFGGQFAVPFAIMAGVPCFLGTFGIGIHRIYVANEGSDYSFHWAVGEPMFKFSNQHNARVSGNCIVNNSTKVRVLENVSYGSAESETGRILNPYSVATLPNFNIHYFFAANAPPEKIQSKTGSASQWWLRDAEARELQAVVEEERESNLAMMEKIRSRLGPPVNFPGWDQPVTAPQPSAIPVPPTLPVSESDRNAPRKHGLRFGQGRRDLDLLEANPGASNTPQVNDPYPVYNPSPEEIQRIEDQVNQDMQRIMIRDQIRQERGY